eukprot:300424-Amphidinium_carterae.2
MLCPTVKLNPERNMAPASPTSALKHERVWRCFWEEHFACGLWRNPSQSRLAQVTACDFVRSIPSMAEMRTKRIALLHNSLNVQSPNQISHWSGVTHSLKLKIRYSVRTVPKRHESGMLVAFWRGGPLQGPEGHSLAIL